MVIETTSSDTVRVKTYMEWDNLIYFNDPQLDLEINFKVAEICAKNLDNINQLSEKEIVFFKKNQGSAFNNLAIIFKNQGNFEAALEYNQKSLVIKEEIDDKKGISNTYINMGSIFHTQGDLIKALEYYYKCLKIREEIDDQKGISIVLNNIGAVYHYQDDYTNALKFYYKSLEIRKKVDGTIGISKAYSNIGFVYFEQGDSALAAGNHIEAHKKFDAALENYIECLNINKEINDKSGLAMIHNHIGTVYYKKGKLDIALDYFLLSAELNEELKSKQSLASSLSNVANIYMDKKQYDKALDYGNKAYKLAKESNSILELSSISLLLHKVYKLTNKPALSLLMYEEHISIKDSISSREGSLQTIQQQFKYEYDKKAAADSVVKAEEIKVKNAEINAQKAEASKQKLEIEYQKQQKFYLFIGIFGLLFFGVFLINRVVVIQKQKKVIVGQKNEVELQKQQIEHQHHQLEETHQEISDSIKYAERLQLAILPSREDLNEHLGNGFVLFKPKDVVSGDFYWLHQLENTILFAAADCTGHGVPGAMVSVVCSNSLNRSVKEFGLSNPGQILDKTRDLVIETFARSGKDVKDGMDISLVSMHNIVDCEGKQKKVKIEFSGANNPLWIVRKNSLEVEDVKGDKQPVSLSYNMTDFTSKEIILQEGDTIYLFTDGYADQFGGEKGKKFKYAPFKDFLISIQEKSMDDQKMLIEEKFYNWKGDFEQVDDVCIIGVRI